MFYIHFISYYGIYWTNLLTRCHSASCVFSAVFRFSTQEIFSELDGTKTQPPIFPTRTRSPKWRRRGARGIHTTCGAAPPLGAPGSGVGPTGALDHRTSAYLYPPKNIDHLPRKVPSHCHHRNEVSTVKKSCSGTLPGQGLTPGAISIDSTASTLTP